MKKVELLSPAGNFESLQMAVENGCNAVYLGGKKFGARAFSNNFDDSELVKAVQFCHLYGVKIYITINTIVYDEEIDSFINYAKFLYKIGVDAVIVQDYGMIDLLKKILPNLELHASTQMNIHTVEELKIMKQLGFSRVVLAREVSIDTIREMKNQVDIELEVFVHGALCVSCSGQCLMSYMVGKRSGNRGECAGICRQKYSLYENDKKINLNDEYLLSTKDLCLIDYLNDLIEIGVDSFKIEGRMKSKEYVAAVTRGYRNAIDFKPIKKDKINMLKMFNRGYTLGNLYNKKGKEFINGYRPNHMGYQIGDVIKVSNNKVSIKLIEDISQGDGIRFICDAEFGFNLNKIYKDNLLVNSANAGDIIQLDIFEKVKVGTKIYKTMDTKLIKELNDSSVNRRKISLNGSFIVKNSKIIFEVTDGNIRKTIKLNDVAKKAKKRPITEFEVREKLNKLGNSSFIFNDLKIDIPNDIFISMSIINDLRRQMVDYIMNERMHSERELLEEKNIYKSMEYSDVYKLIFDISNKDQLDYIIENTNYNCYVSDYLLYKQYEDNKRIIYKKSRVEPLKITTNNYELVGEISSIKKNSISDVYFNIVNSYAVNFLHNLGVQRVTLSYEMEFDNVKELINTYNNNYKVKPNLEVIVYGKPEVMVSKYCLVNTFVGDGLKTHCNLCKNNNYYLKDKFNNYYEIKKSNDCYMRILDYKNIDRIDEIKNMNSIGINTFRIVLNHENIDELKALIKRCNI